MGLSRHLRPLSHRVAQRVTFPGRAAALSAAGTSVPARGARGGVASALGAARLLRGERCWFRGLVVSVRPRHCRCSPNRVQDSPRPA